MTTTADKLKADIIAKIEKRWDTAREDALRFFAHKDPKVRRLAHALCSMREHDFWTVIGAEEKVLSYQEYNYGGALSRLDFIRFFIGHEILDDGEPALAYFTHSHVRVMLGREPTKHPYFHRKIGVLHETEPNAPWLTVDLALAVLQSFVDDRPRRLKAIRHYQAVFNQNRPEEIEHIIKGTNFDQQMLALADELAAEAKTLI